MAYIVHNGTLIDGNGGEPVHDAAILVEGNHIRAIGPAASLMSSDSAITRIDAGGGYILPGFIDAHVHLMLEGFDIPAMLATPFSLNFYKAIDD